MVDNELVYKNLIDKLKKEELLKLIDEYNILFDIFGLEKITDIRGKKSTLIEKLVDSNSNYIKCLIKTMDYKDFLLLRDIVGKSWDNTFNVENKDFINYLVSKMIIFKEDNGLVMSRDVSGVISDTIKDRSVIKYIKNQDEMFRIADGMILAYGVVDIAYFKEVVGSHFNVINYYYKKDYDINEKMVVSKKLSSKKRINKYFKNKDYKKFSNKEFLALGKHEYHHGIKSFKKFIHMLKSNYVFNNRDIEFVDKMIVTPFLYTSINEEEVALKNLEEVVISYFEFKGDKLKLKMLDEIKMIREDFPLWEYRGFKRSDKHEK